MKKTHGQLLPLLLWILEQRLEESIYLCISNLPLLVGPNATARCIPLNILFNCLTMHVCYAVMVLTNVVILNFCDYSWLVSEMNTASSPSAPHAQSGIPQAGPSHLPRHKQGNISPRSEWTEPHCSAGRDFLPISPGHLKLSLEEALRKCYALQIT